MKKTFDKNDIAEIVLRLTKEEAQNCNRFCELNRGNEKAIRERQHDEIIYVSAINHVLYEVCKH